MPLSTVPSTRRLHGFRRTKRETTCAPVTLKLRATGRFSLTADYLSMQVIAAMLMNCWVAGVTPNDPLSLAIARRALRAFGRSGLL